MSVHSPTPAQGINLKESQLQKNSHQQANQIKKKVDKDALTRSAGRGAFWQIMGGGWQTVVRLAASTVLARVLAPEDFGLFGMALLAQGLISHIGALGMGTGIIAKKDVSEDDLCTCFWTMAGMRFVLFIATFAIAPLAAAFFDTPKVIWVLRAVSFTFLFSILSAVSTTLLQKQLRFGNLVVINGLSALLESGIAVALALLTDFRYWALVFAMLISSLFMHLTIFVWVKWYPKFKFSKESFRYLFRFGINNLGFSIVNYFHQNIDYLLVGRLLGTASLGFYEFAYRIPHLIQVRFARPVGGVVFPALSKVQDSNERLIAGYVKAVKYIALSAFPVLGGLAVLADLIVTVLWGGKWMPIVVPLRILCLCAAIRCSMQPLGSIFLCKDRPDIPFKFGLVRLVFTFFVVGVLGYLYGLNGVAGGMLASTLPAIYIFHLAFKMTESSPLKLLSALWVPAAATGTSMLCAYGMTLGLKLFELAQWSVLVCSVLAGVAGYVVCLFGLFPVASKEILETISAIVGRKVEKGKKIVNIRPTLF